MTLQSIQKRTAPVPPSRDEPENRIRPVPSQTRSYDASQRMGHFLNNYSAFAPDEATVPGAGENVVQRMPEPDSVDEILDQVPSELPHERGRPHGKEHREDGLPGSISDRNHGVFEAVGDRTEQLSRLLPEGASAKGPLKFLQLDAKVGSIASDYDVDGKSSRSRLGRSLDAIGYGLDIASDFVPKPLGKFLSLGAAGFKAEAWVENNQDAVLDNPLVSRLFAHYGLDYGTPETTPEARKPETVAPPISEEEWDKSYGQGSSTK